MKIQCEGCGELVEPGVNATVRGVELTCPGCGHVGLLGGGAAAGPAPVAPAREAAAVLVEARRPAAVEPARAPAPDPVGVVQRGVKVAVGEGAVRCPKCGYRQEDEAACHRCGLVFARADVSRPWEAVAAEQASDVEELERRWGALVGGAMGDREAHRGFTAWARERRLLEQAARRYRFYAQDHAGTPEAEAASEALGRIVELMHAEFVLREGAASASDDLEGRVRQVKRGLVVVAILMSAGVLALALYIFGPFR